MQQVYYFVAIAYQQIPHFKCLNIQNSLLSQSTYVQELNQLVKCKYDYKLKYLNNKWHLEYKTIDEELTSKNLDTFFVNVKNKDVQLSSTSYFLHEGEGFHFKIASKKDLYISLLDVYDDGKVGIVLNNKYMKHNSTIIYPSKESSQEFVAALNKPNVATKDMYIALFSNKHIDLSMFEEQSDSVVSNSEYRLDVLVNLVKKYNYTSIVLKTKP